VQRTGVVLQAIGQVGSHKTTILNICRKALSKSGYTISEGIPISIVIEQIYVEEKEVKW